MNLITNADVKKFLTLVKAGMQNGKQKELKNYTAATNYDGISAVKDYYVHLEFSFRVDSEVIDALFSEDDFDITNQVKNLMSGL